MQWISVEDRLPETGSTGYSEEVAYWMTDGTWDRGHYWKRSYYGYWGDPWGDGPIIDARQVTHWMTIEPPKEEVA